MPKKPKCLLREYEERKPVGECGKKGLKESETTLKANEVGCEKCKKTKAFAKADKHPLYGTHKPKKRVTLEEWEEEMFNE